MSTYGGRRSGSGRKRIYTSVKEGNKVWRRAHHRIWIENMIYLSWASAKLKCGYSTDSKFAAHLLSLERRRRENDLAISCAKRSAVTEVEDGPSPKRRRHFEGGLLFSSTPVKPAIATVAESPNLSLESIDAASDADIDVTGVSVLSVNGCSYQVVNDSVLVTSDAEKYQDADDLMSDSDSSDTAEITDIRDLTDALQDLDEDFESDKDSLSDSYEDDDLELSFLAEEDGEELDESDQGKNVSVDVGSSVEVQEERQLHAESLVHAEPQQSLSEVSEVPVGTVINAEPQSTAAPAPRYPKLSRLEDQKKLEKELSLVRETKVLCSLDLVLDLFKNCPHPGCANMSAIKHHLIGPTLIVNWSCPAGHKGKFSSSRDVNEMYSNNLQFAASILFSGNNFAKVEKLAKFLGLSFLSDSTFYRMQRLYLIPCVNEWWSWQREQLIQEFQGKEIVVCGDGQCDSPGHTAKNLCYFLMELVSGYIVEIEVRDKRHVGLASTNMEKQALQNALQRLRCSLNVVEVVTDASPSIKKLMADNFSAVFHCLDVWHKSKSIRKCLTKVGHLKNMEKIQVWADHVILHFWHCANICKTTVTTTDEEALEKMKSAWIGVLHHVCDDHEWTGGKCGHGDLDEHTLPWFDRRDKDFEALQKVVLDPQLLKSFKFYVRFRHTGSLECANSLSLVYTPKRCSYSYKVYKARKQLAAIDWNFHLNQDNATTKGGEIIVTRKYNQRTKEWNSKVVKVKKQYEYISVLMAKVLHMRKEDVDVVTRNVSLNESDPALVAPTIADKPAPPSKELFSARKSRFKTSNTEEVSQSHTSHDM